MQRLLTLQAARVRERDETKSHHCLADLARRPSREVIRPRQSYAGSGGMRHLYRFSRAEWQPGSPSHRGEVSYVVSWSENIALK